ncbi:MAG: hypothetical protein PHF86_00985 [Candidatus Nanoarchaeia archaeon]|nr:hypothetical protein [Candidatus Nanoarchaeia archaeon]
MEGYLGETDVNISESKFKDYTSIDWAMYFIERYGQIDGSHHKTWVLDQVARILKGTKIIVKLAKWSNGKQEYRVWLDDPSEEYKNWQKEMQEMLGEFIDNEYEYTYNEGIAP